MLIRRVEHKDLDEILILNNQEAKWVGLEEKSFFEDYLDIPFFYVGEENGEITSFIMAMDQSTDYDSKNFLWFRDRVKEFYYIDRVIVKPEKRGKGVGRALYNELMKKTKGLPITGEVSIDPPNIESLKFHERFNFKKIGEFSSDGKKLCAMYIMK